VWENRFSVTHPWEIILRTCPALSFLTKKQKVFFFYFQCKKEHFSKKDEKENNFNYRKLNQ